MLDDERIKKAVGGGVEESYVVGVTKESCKSYKSRRRREPNIETSEALGDLHSPPSAGWCWATLTMSTHGPGQLCCSTTTTTASAEPTTTTGAILSFTISLLHHLLALLRSLLPASWRPLSASAPPPADEDDGGGMDPNELKRVFQMFDRNGDGRITRKELGHSLENLGIFIPEEDLVAMIDKIDANGDGCVDMEEFGDLYRTIMDDKDEEEDIREAFNVFDQNRDGFITVEELRSVLASLGLKQGRTIDDCRKMIKKVDVDGDGMIDFKEFKQMMRRGGFAALG